MVGRTAWGRWRVVLTDDVHHAHCLLHGGVLHVQVDVHSHGLGGYGRQLLPSTTPSLALLRHDVHLPGYRVAPPLSQALLLIGYQCSAVSGSRWTHWKHTLA